MLQSLERRSSSGPGNAAVVSAMQSEKLFDLVSVEAREKYQPDVVLAELKHVVAAQRRRLERLEGLAMDRMPPDAADRARIAVLEAEIRLLMEQKQRQSNSMPGGCP